MLPGGVGLTTALAVLPSGWVVVGSLPTSDGTSATAQRGAVIVLNPYGQVVRVISGALINGPWDLTAAQVGHDGLFFVTKPIPLTAFILVLASKNGVRKGAGFIFGWLASLAVVIAVTVLVAAGVATIVEAKLSNWQNYLAVFLFGLIATPTYLTMEIYAGFKPRQTQAFPAKTRTWIDTHTDQVIVIVSAVLGFWLIGGSIYLIVA